MVCDIRAKKKKKHFSVNDYRKHVEHVNVALSIFNLCEFSICDNHHVSVVQCVELLRATTKLSNKNMNDSMNFKEN